MKFIHCADLHLDSKLSANLDKEKAKERKAEVLHSFVRLVQFAVENHVRGILIAGDMFDTKNISATVKNTVLSQIMRHPDINFYYLKGNHDSDNFLTEQDHLENLKMFDDKWTTYTEADGRIVISGMELHSENSGSAAHTYTPDVSKFNIVMLHGQQADGDSKHRAENINLKDFRNKGIDYLALGHVHAYQKEALDARGFYCYPGCLEGRGFDECGEHGFVLLDINEETGEFVHTFVPFAFRKLYTLEADVTGLGSTAEMSARMQEILDEKQYDGNSLLKVVLTGSVDVECEKDITYLATMLADRFYFAKVYDETSLSVRQEDYMLDKTLKGEFVRMVMAQNDLSENEKGAIIRYGLQALAGEEID